MAKISPAAPAADSVNSAAETPAQDLAVNAIPAATPDNTPVPGGGRWAWDYPHACWVEVLDPLANPFPTLE